MEPADPRTHIGVQIPSAPLSKQALAWFEPPNARRGSQSPTTLVLSRERVLRQLDGYTWDREAERQLANLIGYPSDRHLVLTPCRIDALVNPRRDPRHL
jgi:hypothetical protein